MEELDILTIDLSIKENFLLEEKNLSNFEKILDKISNDLSDTNISHRTRENLIKNREELTEKIQDINSKKTYNFLCLYLTI